MIENIDYAQVDNITRTYWENLKKEAELCRYKGYLRDFDNVNDYGGSYFTDLPKDITLSEVLELCEYVLNL